MKSYNGFCAYCGRSMRGKVEIDHVNPIWRGREDNEHVILVQGGKNILCRIGDIRGDDTGGNKVYTCKRCNMAKSTMTVEQFRQDIQDTVEKARAKYAQFRLIEDYGVIERTDKRVSFYFEQFEDRPEVKELVGRELTDDQVYLLSRLSEWRSYNRHADFPMEYDEYYSDDERARRVYDEREDDSLLSIGSF